MDSGVAGDVSDKMTHSGLLRINDQDENREATDNTE